MGRSRIVSFHVVELLVVAVIGGALALGGAALFGKLGDHTTIQQMTTTGASGSAPLQAAAGKGLTAEQVYRRDSPGVVQITATTTVAQPQDSRSTRSGTSCRWRRRPSSRSARAS